MPQKNLSETISTTLEKTYPAEFDSFEYVKDTLQKHDVVDTEGISRPAYIINGHEVVFRTRQESPIYADTDVVVPGGAFVYPLEREVWDEATDSDKMTDESAVRAYVDAHQNDAPRIVVTNTPEGMLSAAALLVESEEERTHLQELATAFAKGDTWTEAQKKALDTMLAAISVDDQRSLQDSLNMDGWPLALAALSGDTMAQLMTDTKREGLIEAERERASDPDAVEKTAAWQAENGFEASEPIPLEQLALVHSTSYDIQRDQDGNIILRTAGQHRDDKFPRASLHFTLNSRVGDVVSNGEQQNWADTNKMIVANFKDTIDASRTLPNRMAGMDTWFTLSPGEALKLPGALVVEQVEQTKSGKVIEETDTGVQFVVKDEYTLEESDFLRELSRTYMATGPKDLALRIAMERVGAPVELMDRSSSDGHGMFSRVIGGRVNATATSLGLPSGKHFQTPEANMEANAFRNMPKMLGKQALGRYQLEVEYMSAYSDTAIEARRQALAGGFYPARPNVADEAEAWRYESSEGI